MKVPRCRLYTRQTEDQPIAECNLRRAREPQVVEAIVGPRVKHTVGKKAPGKSNRGSQEQLDAVNDPKIAQCLEETLVSYGRANALASRTNWRVASMASAVNSRSSPSASPSRYSPANRAHGIQQVLVPSRAPCRRCGPPAQPRFHLLNIPVSAMLTLQLCRQVNRRSEPGRAGVGLGPGRRTLGRAAIGSAVEGLLLGLIGARRALRLRRRGGWMQVPGFVRQTTSIWSASCLSCP